MTSMISRYRRARRSSALADGDVQEVSDDESDKSSEEDEDSGVDGERDVKEEFHLGRFCAARTQIYHRFSHWEVRSIIYNACA